jgi:hypothetical protein
VAVFESESLAAFVAIHTEHHGKLRTSFLALKITDFSG